VPLRDRFLQALKDFETAKPRNKQVRLGPSELGGCREYVRNVMVGSPMQEADEWPTAAVVGTLLGTHLEVVAEQYLGAVTEVPVTATLPNGLKVSGHADVVIVEENCCVDAKSKDGLATVRREGASLENLIQISVYTLGLVQAGILKAGATAHLIYVDRAGNDQDVHEVELSWEQILDYVDQCVTRLDEVVTVQEYIEAGDTQYVRTLRDKTPPFCYSPKVMCPFRDLCWKGSEWVPDTEITDPEVIAAVEMYDQVRAEEKEAVKIKAAQRLKLTGVSGVTPSGLAVTWSGSEMRPALYVTQVKDKK
jgi:hypothetical protein